MPPKNRSTLKHFFEKGSLPSQDQFRDLIDSMLNMIDEGFTKTPKDGLEISNPGDEEGLISFWKTSDQTQPVWSLRFDSNKTKLLILDHNDRVVLSLNPDGTIEISGNIKVEGTVSAEGRLGTHKAGGVPADGQWHRITDALSGCHAFEVVAGAGKKSTGNYALMHAIAMNTFHPKGFLFNFLNLKRRIKCHQAYYRSLGNKLKLRWAGEMRDYYLELKSNANYGDGVTIRYSLTNLWFDEDMRESQADLTSDEANG